MQKGDIKRSDGRKQGKDLCLFSIMTLLKGEPTVAFCPLEIIPSFANNCVSWMRLGGRLAG